MKAFKKIRDAIILERVQKGDKDAFAEVYDEYSQKIYRYVFFKVSNKEVAEDLTGQVFLQCWEYIAKERKQVDYLQAFLYSVARNLVIDHYRSRTETVDIMDREMDITDAQPELLQGLINAQQSWQRLLPALRRLPDDHQDVITLRYVEDYSVREIAKILGKTENNVRVTLHRALKSLKEMTTTKE